MKKSGFVLRYRAEHTRFDVFGPTEAMVEREAERYLKGLYGDRRVQPGRLEIAPYSGPREGVHRVLMDTEHRTIYLSSRMEK